MSDNNATLSVGGDAKDYAILNGTVGPQVIDVRKLYANTGMFTYDPGFTSTASCDSGLTYIDGDAGVLLHRGYPIDQLAEQSSFMEVSYLLLNGELPSKKTLEDFTRTITRHTMVHEQLTTFYRGFRRDAHPHGDHVRRGGCAVGLLPRFDGHQRSGTAQDREPSPDRQDADDRGHGL